MDCPLAEGSLEIVDTPDGERMRLTVSRGAEGMQATVSIERPGGLRETLALLPMPGTAIYQSAVGPEEPHEFKAELQLVAGESARDPGLPDEGAGSSLRTPPGAVDAITSSPAYINYPYIYKAGIQEKGNAAWKSLYSLV